jgi:hypothetical protein
MTVWLVTWNDYWDHNHVEVCADWAAAMGQVAEFKAHIEKQDGRPSTWKLVNIHTPDWISNGHGNDIKWREVPLRGSSASSGGDDRESIHEV